MEREEFHEEIRSYEKILQEKKRNLRLLEVKRSAYVESTRIPLDLIKDIEDTEQAIQHTEEKNEELQKQIAAVADEDHKRQRVVSYLPDNVPVISFHGVNGGSGTTTILERFATLMSCKNKSCNVLLVDLDVFTRGLTDKKMSGCIVSECCKTVHEYMHKKETIFPEALCITRKHQENKDGQVYLIPAAFPEAMGIFTIMASRKYNEISDILRLLIVTAINKYQISCVLLDCSSAINPYTAAGIYLSQVLFIISDIELFIQNYSQQVRQFYPDFTPQNVKIIVNKVSHRSSHLSSTFAAIHFAEELAITRQPNIIIFPTIFDEDICRIIYRTFEEHRSYLVPEWITLSRNFQSPEDGREKPYLRTECHKQYYVERRFHQKTEKNYSEADFGFNLTEDIENIIGYAISVVKFAAWQGIVSFVGFLRLFYPFFIPIEVFSIVISVLSTPRFKNLERK